MSRNTIFQKARHYMNPPYQKIISYVEIEENLASLYGVRRKMKIDERLVDKTTTFDIIAIDLETSCGFPLLNRLS